MGVRCAPSLSCFLQFLRLPHGSSFVFFSLASRSFVAKLKNTTAAVLGSPANSLGSGLSHFLSNRTSRPCKQKVRQPFSASTTVSRPPSSVFTCQASVVLADGERAQRPQTAPFPALRDRHSAFCSRSRWRLLKAVFPAFTPRTGITE